MSLSFPHHRLLVYTYYLPKKEEQKQEALIPESSSCLGSGLEAKDGFPASLMHQRNSSSCVPCAIVSRPETLPRTPTLIRIPGILPSDCHLPQMLDFLFCFLKGKFLALIIVDENFVCSTEQWSLSELFPPPFFCQLFLKALGLIDKERKLPGFLAPRPVDGFWTRTQGFWLPGKS